MELGTAHILNSMTADFYSQNAGSFSDTRQNPWPGWMRIIKGIPEVLTYTGIYNPAAFHLLDIGCGNLRFEHALAKTDIFEGNPFDAWCIDNSSQLAESSPYAEDPAYRIHFLNADICELLSSEKPLEDSLDAPRCEACVSFALIHHIPVKEWRNGLLNYLLDRISPGGIGAISFWQLLNSKKLAKKAHKATEYANNRFGLGLDIEQGDCMLGWQDDMGTLRYCHSFTEAEIDELVYDSLEKVPGTFELCRFSADGHTGDLNRYVMFGKYL